MGLFDKFKKDKPESSKAAPGKDEQKSGAKATDVKAEATSEKKESAPVVLGIDTSDLLSKPLLSEKAMMLASSGRYVFIVKREARKPEIKKSIQRIYNVHVEDVKIVNLPAKKRGQGARQSFTSAHKKAIVVLREGEKIAGIIESVG